MSANCVAYTLYKLCLGTFNLQQNIHLFEATHVVIELSFKGTLNLMEPKPIVELHAF